MKQHVDEIIRLLQLGIQNTEEIMDQIEQGLGSEFYAPDTYEREVKEMNDMIDVLKKLSTQWKVDK